MISLTTERPFWQVKAEYTSFEDFLRDVSEREDHIRAGGSQSTPITSYVAGTARVRLWEDGGCRLNIFRPLRELLDCCGTPLVWGTASELLPLMQARYGGRWHCAVASCYLDEKYEGLAWEASWEGLDEGFAQAWRYVWETAELDQALTAAWATDPTLEPLALYRRVWPVWWAQVTGSGVIENEARAKNKVLVSA